MHDTGNELVGVGLYTCSEAARLTGVPAQNIRRWVFGYRYKKDGYYHEIEPVWPGAHPQIDTTIGVDFLDLIEVRLVQAFRSEGVSWHTIRMASKYLGQIFQSRHPFAIRRFQTDGRSIFVQLGAEREHSKLLDVAKSQFAFEKIVRPFLRDVEFGEDAATLWFPNFPSKQIVIDPKRSFGRPIVARGGVPTDVLAKAAEIEDSPVTAAKWYGVTLQEVEAALDFEAKLAA